MAISSAQLHFVRARGKRERERELLTAAAAAADITRNTDKGECVVAVPQAICKV